MMTRSARHGVGAQRTGRSARGAAHEAQGQSQSQRISDSTLGSRRRSTQRKTTTATTRNSAASTSDCQPGQEVEEDLEEDLEEEVEEDWGDSDDEDDDQDQDQDQEDEDEDLSAPGAVAEGPKQVATHLPPDVSPAASALGPLGKHIVRIRTHSEPESSAITKVGGGQPPARKPSGFLAKLVENLRGKRK